MSLVTACKSSFVIGVEEPEGKKKIKLFIKLENKQMT